MTSAPKRMDLERFGEIPDPFAIEAGSFPARSPPRLGSPSPTRSNVRTMRSAAAALAVALQAAWLALLGVRHHPDEVASAGIALQLTFALAGAALALHAGPRAWADLGGRAAPLASLFGAPAVFLAWTVCFGAHDSLRSGLSRETACCLLETTMLALGPLALAAWTLRRAFANASVGRSASVGVACAALAATTMTFACTHRGVLHVAVGHGLAFLTAGALGALLGVRVTMT